MRRPLRPSPPPRCVRVLLAVLAAAGCAREPQGPPAIGFTYAFQDTLFRAFLEREIERERPEGAVRIVVRGADDAAVGAGSLGAEVRWATRLAADPRVIVSVGPDGSREALQVAPIYRGAGVPDLVPTGTSRLLADAGPQTIALPPNDSVQAEVFAAFADTALRAQRVRVLHIPDEYGVGLARFAEAALRRRGIAVGARVTVRQGADCRVAADSTAFALAVEEAARDAAPDVVLIATRTREGACLTAALKRRLPTVRIVLGDGVDVSEEFRTRAAAAAVGVHAMLFWHASVGRRDAADLAARFEREVGRPMRSGEAMYLDGARLAATAIRTVGADRAAVLAWMQGVGTRTPPYVGITGEFSFAPGARRPIYIGRFDGRDFTIVAR